MKTCLIGFLLLGATWGQTPSTMVLQANPPIGVTSLSASKVGSGTATYYYWAVAKFTIGNSPAIPYVQIINAPSTLGGGNSITVNWTAVANVTGYDILRTTTDRLPNACTCAVVLATTALSVTDSGGALLPYTLSTVASATFTMLLDNMNFATPTVVVDKPMVIPGIGGGGTPGGVANSIQINGGGGIFSGLPSLGASTTVLHGNAAGAPSFGAVNLTNDTSGTLPLTKLPAVTSGAGTTVAVTGGVPADGCATFSLGLLGSTGVPCGAGGGGSSPSFTVVTFGATPTYVITSASSQSFKITMTGNVTGGTVNDATALGLGQEVAYVICQDATGGRTFTPPTTATNAGALTWNNFGVVDTTANVCSKQQFVYAGSGLFYGIGGMVSDNPTPGINTAGGLLAFPTAPDTLLGNNGIANIRIKNVSVTFDGGGVALTGTTTRCGYLPYNATINSATLLADQTGSATVDVRTVAFGSYTGPASAASITAAAIPTLSAAVKFQDTTLTGWTTALTSNTVVCFVLSAPATVTWVNATLKVTQQ